MIRRTFVVAVVAMGCLLLGGADAPPAVETVREEMKKPQWLVGRWKGGGWMQAGPQRREFVGTETVQSKLGGLSLLIEGNFRQKGAAADAPPVHETLAVLSYDPEQRHYWLSAWLRSGYSGRYEARVGEGNVVTWYMDIPQGRVRYTIERDDHGRWHETGEMSPDAGKTWHKFLEMTLERE